MVHKPSSSQNQIRFVFTKRTLLVLIIDHYWCLTIAVKIDGLLTDACYRNAIVRTSRRVGPLRHVRRFLSVFGRTVKTQQDNRRIASNRTMQIVSDRVPDIFPAHMAHCACVCVFCIDSTDKIFVLISAGHEETFDKNGLFERVCDLVAR